MFIRMLTDYVISTKGWDRVFLESGSRYDVSENIGGALLRLKVAVELERKEEFVEVSLPEADEEPEPAPATETEPPILEQHEDKPPQPQEDDSLAENDGQSESLPEEPSSPYQAEAKPQEDAEEDTGAPKNETPRPRRGRKRKS